MRARLYILAAALLFSTGGMAIKGCTLTAWQVASFRAGVAALALALLSREARRGWSLSTLGVAFAYAATVTLYVAANKLTTAAAAIFIQSTAPLYLLALGPLVLREPVQRRDWPFVLCLLLGLAMFFVAADPIHATAPDPPLGNLIAALSGVSWAFTILGLRWLSRSTHPASPAAAVLAGNLLAFLGGLPFALPVGEAQPSDWLAIGYLGVFQIALAYRFLNLGIQQLPALEVSLLLLIEPALNPLWTWILHAEVPGPWSIAGGALILGGTVMKAWLDSRGSMGPAP